MAKLPNPRAIPKLRCLQDTPRYLEKINRKRTNPHWMMRTHRCTVSTDCTSGPCDEAGLAAATPSTPREEKIEPLPGAGGYDRPIPPPGVAPIGSLHQPGKATVEGRVRVVEIRSVERNSVLACEISDSTGDLTALFYGRSRIPGLMCGSRVRLKGPVGIKHGAPVMVNPAYELIVPYSGSKPAAGDK